LSKFEAPQWLQEELSRHLGPARAPTGLWDRIQSGGKASEHVNSGLSHPHWARWAVAAILTVAAAVGTYWLPGPQWRSDVALLAADAGPDLRQDHPAEWDLRCTLPGGRSAFRVANLSAQRGHPFALAAAGPEESAIGCQACHSTGTKEHHL